jgi:hypothetical protein
MTLLLSKGTLIVCIYLSVDWATDRSRLGSLLLINANVGINSYAQLTNVPSPTHTSYFFVHPLANPFSPMANAAPKTYMIQCPMQGCNTQLPMGIIQGLSGHIYDYHTDWWKAASWKGQIVCPVCNQSDRKDTFCRHFARRHLSIAGTPKPYACNQAGCIMRFTRVDRLNTHYRQVHKLELTGKAHKKFGERESDTALAMGNGKKCHRGFDDENSMPGSLTVKRACQ